MNSEHNNARTADSQQNLAANAWRAPAIWMLGLTIILAFGGHLPSYKLFSSLESFLPLHITLEFMSIAVSVMVVALTWHLRDPQASNHYAILCGSFLAVALIDLAHTLSYNGMPIFITPNGVEKGLAFWLAGRTIAAVAILAVAVLPQKTYRNPQFVTSLVLGVMVAVGVYIVVLQYQSVLPRTFIQGQGLTPFKIYFEYILSAIYGVSCFFLARNGLRSKNKDLLWLAAAAWSLSLAELFFTMWGSLTDIFNILGHIYKVIAYAMIYVALFARGVKEPYHQVQIQHLRLTNLVSGLQHAETRLQDSEARFRELIERAPDAILVFDADLNRFVEANTRAEQLFQCDRETLLRSGPLNFYVDNQPDGKIVGTSVANHTDQALSGQELVFERRIRTTRGDERICEVRLTRLTSMHRKLLRVSYLDITDRKKTEHELDAYRHDLEDRVKERTHELSDALKAANAASEAKSTFLANMSHELRTPLNAILGMLYLALRSDLSEILRNQLTKARLSAITLLNIINDILDLSKIEAGKLEIEHIEFGLDSVLERLVDVVAVQATGKEIEFLIRLDTAVPSILIGDPLRIGQILLNLCGNAVKFTERGEVELAIKVEGATSTTLTLRLCVKDSGIGMSDDVQKNLFNKFTQADQSMTRRFGGTGLGLSICKNLVEMMQGRIWVEHSLIDVGSTLCFTIPLEISPAAQIPRETDMVAESKRLLGNLHALAVDDNPLSADILAEMLGHLNMRVEKENSGAATLARIESAQEAYHFVLVDWKMPGITGQAVVRKIRELARSTKIIVLTTHGLEDVMLEAQRAGADAILVKPISPMALMDTLIKTLVNDDNCTQENAQQLVAPRTALRGHYEFAGIRLLLVEDNEINREFAGELLRNEDIEVDEAVNGLEAVTRVQECHYDIVLMDIQMPIMDGLEATRQIRALGQLPGNERFDRLPILAMTALAMSNDAEKSVDAGMNDFVVKPVEPDELFAAMAKWVRRPTRLGEPARNSSENVPPDLSAMKSVDARQGIHRIGGSGEAYRRQLRRFAKSYSHAGDQLRELLAKSDLGQVENFCHALKGVTGNIGAQAVYTLISEIDSDLKRGERPTPMQLEHLDEKLRILIDEILNLDATLARKSDVSELTTAEISELLRELAHAIEFDLGSAEQVLAKLRPGTAGTSIGMAVETIAKYIDRFDTVAAQDHIVHLQKRVANL